MTIGNNFTGNVALHRHAAELAIRPPQEPEGGDAADDKMIVVDPHSGLSFEIASYKGYMKRMIEVRCLYDVKAWKPDAIARCSANEFGSRASAPSAPAHRSGTQWQHRFTPSKG
jgi:hypothetical protein